MYRAYQAEVVCSAYLDIGEKQQGYNRHTAQLVEINSHKGRVDTSHPPSVPRLVVYEGRRKRNRAIQLRVDEENTRTILDIHRARERSQIAVRRTTPATRPTTHTWTDQLLECEQQLNASRPTTSKWTPDRGRPTTATGPRKVFQDSGMTVLDDRPRPPMVVPVRKVPSSRKSDPTDGEETPRKKKPPTKLEPLEDAELTPASREEGELYFSGDEEKQEKEEAATLNAFELYHGGEPSPPDADPEPTKEEQAKHEEEEAVGDIISTAVQPGPDRRADEPLPDVIGECLLAHSEEEAQAEGTESEQTLCNVIGDGPRAETATTEGEEKLPDVLGEGTEFERAVAAQGEDNATTPTDQNETLGNGIANGVEDNPAAAEVDTIGDVVADGHGSGATTEEEEQRPADAEEEHVIPNVMMDVLMTGTITGDKDERSTAEDDIKALDDLIGIALMGNLKEPEPAESEEQPPEGTLPDVIGGMVMEVAVQEEAPAGAPVDAVADAAKAPEEPSAEEEEEAAQPEPLGDVLGSMLMREPGEEPNVSQDLIGALGWSLEPHEEQAAPPAERAVAPPEEETGASSELAPLGDIIGSMLSAEGGAEAPEAPSEDEPFPVADAARSAEVQPLDDAMESVEQQDEEGSPVPERAAAPAEDEPAPFGDIAGSVQTADHEPQQAEEDGTSSSEVQPGSNVIGSPKLPDHAPEDAIVAEEELTASSDVHALGGVTGSLELRNHEPEAAAEEVPVRAVEGELAPLGDIVRSVLISEGEPEQAEEPEQSTLLDGMVESLSRSAEPPQETVAPLSGVIESVGLPDSEQAAMSDVEPVGDTIESRELPAQELEQAAQEASTASLELQPLGDVIGLTELPERAEAAADGEAAASSESEPLPDTIGSQEFPDQETAHAAAEGELAVSSEAQPLVHVIGSTELPDPAPESSDVKLPSAADEQAEVQPLGDVVAAAGIDARADAEKSAPGHGAGLFLDRFLGETPHEAARAPSVAAEEKPHGGGKGFIERFLGTDEEPEGAAPQAEPEGETYQTYGWDQVDPDEVPDIPMIDYDNPDQPPAFVV